MCVVLEMDAIVERFFFLLEPLNVYELLQALESECNEENIHNQKSKRLFIVGVIWIDGVE